jgi:putative heme-binding domain-containing protein
MIKALLFCRRGMLALGMAALLGSARPALGASRPAPGAPGQATPAESLTTLQGFKVELVRSSQPGEGSWVSLTFDPKGRLIVSPQDKEPMLRLTLADGKITKIEKIELPITGAMGMRYAFGSLYVNGNGPDGYHLYRLLDTNGDDKFDVLELVRKWKGGAGEHGAHGIVVGPDQKLYMVNGNFVDVPEDILPTSPHRNYRDDQVLPRMEDGNGFGAGRKPPGGFVVRMDKTGLNAELFASGERNTYDIAFSPEGELFGFDSDMEWDWGAPWYRPIRIGHLISGAEHGFREGSAKWPEYYPDSLPAVVNVGIGSPTGVGFGTGAKFPAKYQRACYALDWSYGRIVAVHLTPEGAGYGGTFETFVAGKPLNVTDVEVSPDGSMYFTIGGRRTQGGLYRVTYTGSESTKPVKGSGESSATVKARALRHELERFHNAPNPAALKKAWPHLGSPDREIRYAARLAVERQPVEQWAERALNEPQKRASLTALLALARYGTRAHQDGLLKSLSRAWPNLADDGEKLEGLRIWQVCFSRMGLPSAEAGRDIVSSLQKVFPSRSWPMNREASQLLIALNAPGVVKQVLDLRDGAATQEEQLHYMVELRNVKTGWTLEERKRYFGWFANRPGGTSYFAGRSTKHTDQMVQWFKDVDRDYSDGASFNNFLKNLRLAAVQSLGDSEKSALATFLDVAPITAAQPRREHKFVREWKTSDVLGDLDRAGQGRSFENGREAYLAAQCAACHRFGDEGGAVGPDLTAIASRFARRDLLESILEPSKVVSEQYQNITVTSSNGDDVTGRLVEELPDKLVLVPNQLTGEKVEVKKSDVKTRVPSKLSPMPEGLVNILTKEEILDLLAYLESAGKKQHAAFRK